MKKILRNILAGTALAGNLIGCGLKTEKPREIDDLSVSCEILTIDNRKALVVDEVHGGNTLDYDADAGFYRLSDSDMRMYFDVGPNSKLDIYIETNFRRDRRPTKPIQEVTTQIQIIDDSGITYDPSKYLYPSPPSPKKTTVGRDTETAQRLQKQFESLRGRCES